MNGFYFDKKDGVVTLRCAALDAAGFEKHCFTTRAGGVSEGHLASLNLSFSRESEQNVRENYRRVFEAAGFSGHAALSAQEHTDVVREAGADCLERDFTFFPAPTDALVTKAPGVCLTVFVADCVPVLIADPEKRAVAAVHSGWRGTRRGICKNAVRELEKRYGSAPRALIAAVGPCIGPCCYEVGGDVYEEFGDPRFFTPRGDKYMLDLPAAVKDGLVGAGLLPENVHVSGECTMCRSDIYFSHRATKGKRGNMAAMIEL